MSLQYSKIFGTEEGSIGVTLNASMMILRKKIIELIGVRISWLTVDVKFSVYC